MFSLFNGIYDSYLAPSQLNVLIVGGPTTGKSALLERLKVTEIPTRHSKNVQNRLGAEQMTQTLHAAFVETGAIDIVGRRESSIREMTKQQQQQQSTSSNIKKNLNSSKGETSDHTPTETKKPAATPSGPVIVKPRKKRFSLNICPAPERYLKSTQDQDEEFVDDEEERKQLLTPADGPSTSKRLESEGGGGLNDSFSDPPQRVRCHSKEFDVDSIDLMDANRSSMQDIPLNESLKQRATSNESTTSENSSARQSVQPRPTILGPPLLQESTEEYDLKPKGKMLPLTKIRPTSKLFTL
jgi:hypothetical protein